MTATSLVLVERTGHVARVSINRPEARNALNAETISLLTGTFESIAREDTVRVIVLSGAGSDAFCSGADITELVHNSTADGRRHFFDSVATLIGSIHRCPQPVVAKVYGYALAGGCGLAAACDITLCADDAVFGLPEVAIGLAPMVVMAPIHRAIGRKALSELVLLAERIPAQRALEMGLVNRVVPKAALEEETESVVSRLKKMSPEALARSKRAMLDVAEKEYDAFIHELADRSALLSLGSEAREGLSAFLEKREPSWR